MNESLLTALVAIVFGGLGGVLFGLWFGERGRRKDLMWYTQQSERPKDLNQAAEFESHPDPEEEALHQVELQVMREGIREELRKEGRTASKEDIEQEALLMVTQMNSEP